MEARGELIDSGVDWLGAIPSAWPRKHLRYVLKQSKMPVGSKASDFELLSLTLRGIIPRSDVEGGKNPENYNTYQIVHENDLIVCLFDYDVTPRTVGRATGTGMVTGAYTVLKPLNGVSTRFYNYFFLSLDESKQLLHLCTGLRNGLSKPTFFGLTVPVPNIETQNKIADFLDVETIKIDDLIGKQQSLLQLLEEKRRATIINTVTRGLDQNADFKETNIPWFDKIPAHWKLNRLKTTILSQKNGAWGSEPDGGEEDVNCIRVADFDRYRLSISEVKFTQRSIPKKDQHGRLLQRGDLLFEKSGGGDNQLVGQIVKYDSDKLAVTSNFVSKLIVANGYNVDYLVYLHASLYYQRVNFRSIKQTSGIQNIDSTAYFNEQVALPEKEEQGNIARHIESELEKLDILKQKILTQINLFRERRTSLISHAVTGKVKI